jgi:hypothetical protein
MSLHYRLVPREKRKAGEEVEAAIAAKTTMVTFQGEEFLARAFIDQDWDKSTQCRFARWVKGFSELDRSQQRLVDQDTGEEPTEIQGKALILLEPDEEWVNGCVALREKKVKKFPWRGHRLSPVRKLTGKPEGCFQDEDEKRTSVGQIVRMLRKSQGIRMQPSWVGICSPRLHMNEGPPKKGWWAQWLNQKFIDCRRDQTGP